MEPLNHLVWRRRASCVASLLASPLELQPILERAHERWKWPHYLTLNTIAAGEGRELRAIRWRGKWLYGAVPGKHSAGGAEKLRKVGSSDLKPTKRIPVRTF